METGVDIRAFGAHGDGTTENTAAIQQAIDACHAAGGGRVYCGPGDYLTGALVLKSYVELHLAAGCRLVGSTRLEDYQELTAPGLHGEFAPEKSTTSLIRAVEAEHIAITGPGEINGSGLAFYDTGKFVYERFFAKPPTPRPRMVTFYRCRDVRVEGAAFIDAPCWTFWLMQCERVAITRVRVAGDQRMINNDGIDVDGCREVTISDSIFKTGDDCLALRAIARLYDAPSLCERVTVTNCVLDSWCQGVRVGCPGDGEIRHCTFSNLVIACRGSGILFQHPRRYLPEGHAGSADIHEILFSNVTIDSDASPIALTVEEGIALPRLAGISFSDCRVRGGRPCQVLGSPETTIRDIRFANMRIDTSGGDAILCRHCEGVTFDNVEVGNCPDRL